MYPISQQGDFPFSALPPLMQAAAMDICAKTKCPLAMAVAAIIGSAAHAAQGHFNVVRPGSGPSSMGLYIVVLANSGEGKSPSVKLAFGGQREFESIVAQHTERLKADFDVDAFEWEEELRAIRKEAATARKKGLQSESVRSVLRAHLEKKPLKRLIPRITLADVTPEAIGAAITAVWPSIGLIADEGDGLLNGRAFGDMPLLTKGWDGDRVYIDRVDKSAQPVSEPRITLLAMIQPSLFDKFIARKGREAHELGLFARTLICHPQSTKGFGFKQYEGYPVSTNGLDMFCARTLEILKRTWDPERGGNFERKSVTFSADAASYWIETCNNIEAQCAPGGIFCRMTAYASKIGDNIARTAATFASVCEYRTEISLDDVRRADTVIGYFTAEHRRLFPPVIEMPVAQANAYRLEAELVEKVKKEMTLCFGKRKFQQNAKVRNEHFKPALAWLVGENKLSLRKEDKQIFIDLNPAVFAWALV